MTVLILVIVGLPVVFLFQRAFSCAVAFGGPGTEGPEKGCVIRETCSLKTTRILVG